jgi:large subunit ribosomal protein L3
VPVTVVEAGPCAVVQKKTEATDGYSALQLGFEPLCRESKVTKAAQGALRQETSCSPVRYLREIRVSRILTAIEVGQEIKADVFSPGEKVTRNRYVSG